MRNLRASHALTPAAAIVSALATLTCCLPLGIGAALGALGLSVVFASFQIWFLILSIIFLLVGLFQLLRKQPNCRRRSRTAIALWCVSAAVVIPVVLFPQWVAGLIVSHFP